MAVVFGVLLSLLLLPVALSSLDSSSGFVAYAEKWQTNSAGFLILSWIAKAWPFAWPESGLVARALAGGLLILVVLYVSLRSKPSPESLLQGCFICIAALFLLSPTQFPWYFLWVAPLLPLFPVRGLLLAVVTLPLYYAYFHLDPRGAGSVQTYYVVWVVWLPVWALLAFDLFRNRTLSE